MVRVKFKNMDRSELAARIAEKRITEAVDRFPKARPKSVLVTLRMDNSPKQAGPDLYGVRAEILGGRYHGVILEKESHDLYKALAYVRDGLLERLNRYSDRLRTKARKERRQFLTRNGAPRKSLGGLS